MHIANIIEEGKLGGPQVRMMKVAAALHNKVDTTLIMPDENSRQFQKRCDELGIGYKTFPLSRITKEWGVALKYIFLSAFEVLYIAWYLRNKKFDLVHVSGGSWQYKGVIAGKLAGVKVLWHLNDSSMPEFIRKIFSLVSRLADGFVFASERTKNYYQPLMQKGKPEFVIQAPVDTSEFTPEGEFSGDDDLIGGWGQDFVVGMVSNISPVKGLETFIRAAAEVNKKIDSIRFVVVGPIYNNQKKYFYKMQQLCSELCVSNIEFVGGRGDVRNILKRLNVYVCSSKAESSPISVWEAMAMSKPIVSTNVGDVPVYVSNNFNGYIVDIGDYDSMAESVAYLAKRPAVCAELGANARDTVIRHLDVKQCADKHLSAYSEMLK